ncbi:hypothetical protein [Catalinimonas locisalis]|uniref:hypothetical protein n=1 Tax=Catalinimonas locisalis TaxID=3133978 RepID=UPI003101ABBE
MCNLEGVYLSLTGEYLEINSEHYFFYELLRYKKKIERTDFNRYRKRPLFHIESVRQALSVMLNMQGSAYLVISYMPYACRSVSFLAWISSLH